MYGEIIILNMRTKKSVRAYGVFTRNFAKLLTTLLNTYGLETQYVNLKAADGSEFIELAKGILRDVNARYYNNVYVHLSVDPTYYCYSSTGLLAKVTDADYSPTPADYDIPAVKETVLLTSLRILENPNNTVVVISGSRTLASPLTVRGVGIYSKLYVHHFGSSFTCAQKEALIDAFSVSPIEFSAGDALTISYRITLA